MEKTPTMGLAATASSVMDAASQTSDSEPASSGVPCSALLAELEAALRRDACIIAKIARRGDDPKNNPAFARYCALEDAYEAERRYSANESR